jgi:methylthioribose-1-phosphate isomerase
LSEPGRSPINRHHRSLEYDPAAGCVRIIDQTLLPARFALVELRGLEEFCHAISAMQVRGAPLIGITGAYGLALSLGPDAGRESLQAATARLASTRPTAVNLRWALARVTGSLDGLPVSAWRDRALAEARAIAEEDIAACHAIGRNGLPLLESIARERRGPVNVLTHCNAGRLATLEWGTATAPVYLAHRQGVPVHVWVSETRPRNQGAGLTAWELSEAGVPFTLVADNAAGALMQAERVDCVLVGSDRTAANGDVCNKIGTYMKAVLARRHGIPFYAALPLSTIDRDCPDGSAIPIEERAAAEVLSVTAPREQGQPRQIPLSVPGAAAWNPAFDVTPAGLVTAIITEAGVVSASPEGIASLR